LLELDTVVAFVRFRVHKFVLENIFWDAVFWEGVAHVNAPAGNAIEVLAVPALRDYTRHFFSSYRMP
jgi:hypothetical protein